MLRWKHVCFAVVFILSPLLRMAVLKMQNGVLAGDGLKMFRWLMALVGMAMGRVG
jgi:hypothetical protein